MREHVDVDALVDATRRLVQVDTQNPPGAEREAIGTARALLAPLGASFAEVEPEPGRASLIAALDANGAGGSRPTLIVNGHLDVVPVDRSGWTRDPFAADVDGGRIWGRGTADMKGGIAAAIEAVHAVRRSGRDLAVDLVFHLVADEERGGGLGARVLAAEGHVRGDACLVPEPTNLAVGIAERGILVATITVHGRPAHASEPANGVSAIEKAARIVLALHNADFGDGAHPLLGTPTCNAGEIAGGSGHNTVAEGCEIVVDRRLLPGVSEEEAVAGLRARIEAIGDPDLRYDLDVSLFGEASELAPDHWLTHAVRESIRAVLGEDAPVIGMPFTTDARFVRNQAGVPAVVCGPGDVAEAHGFDEWVAIDRLADAAAVYAHLYTTNLRQ
jgi:acetylornithine deacetylase/succinyl-diaminopimelate desuccinylase